MQRVAVAALVGVVSACICRAILKNLGVGGADFNWHLRAARDLLAHRDPYDYPFNATIPYPLPAAMFAVPFARLSNELAGALFFGLSSAALAFAITRESFTRLLVFLAYPYWAAMLVVQWSPLVSAAALVSWLVPITMAKPQIGLPVFLTHMSRRGVVACLLVAAVSLLVMPRWPLRWLSQIGYYQNYVPLLVLPGPALLLAIYRRRDPDSHLLLLLASAPQRWFYETFVLWLIPKDRREILATVALSWGAGIYRWYHTPTSWSEVGSWAVLWIYLPMLGIILLRRKRDGCGPAPQSQP
jgi:hypothetical protein